jgi:hypothetical protein
MLLQSNAEDFSRVAREVGLAGGKTLFPSVMTAGRADGCGARGWELMSKADVHAGELVEKQRPGASRTGFFSRWGIRQPHK